MNIHPANKQIKTIILIVVIALLGMLTFVLSSALQKKSGPSSPVTTFKPKAATSPISQTNRTYTKFISINNASKPASPSALFDTTPTPTLITRVTSQLTTTPTPTNNTPTPTTLLSNQISTTPTITASASPTVQVSTTITPTPSTVTTLPSAGYMQYLTIIFIAAITTIAISLLF